MATSGQGQGLPSCSRAVQGPALMLPDWPGDSETSCNSRKATVERLGAGLERGVVTRPRSSVSHGAKMVRGILALRIDNKNMCHRTNPHRSPRNEMSEPSRFVKECV